MCGRITLAELSWREFRDWLVLSRAPETPIESRYNLAPTGNVPIIRQGPDGPEGAVARWWFIPEWHRGTLSDWKASTLNARSEEAATRPTYRDALRRRRCVVLASGYYEWQVRADGKHPHYIHPAGNAPALLMAGLWSEVRLPDFQGLTCAILTEAARGPLAGIHDRMPLMIAPASLPEWLGGCAIADLPRLPPEALDFHEVGARVNSVRNDDASLIRALDA
ncbi:MAG: SOS response-associated peptidase [Rubellimicrobium sp.]|nr:SOS response-associated peptidase [Rubellimicrobium sp.]